MKLIKALVVVTILCTSSYLFAEPVSLGINIDKANADMQAHKYKETALAMGPGNESDKLGFWRVDDGTLIAVYSKKDRKIKRLTFWFADDRPKSMRKEFGFSVLSFDPESGVMSIQTRKPEGEQAAP